MVAERGVWPPQERTPDKTCEQVVDVRVRLVVGQVLEVPKNSSQDRNLQGTVEQIPDDPVLEKAKQLVEMPKTVLQDGIQQRTVEQIVDAPVPQAVEELADVSKVFSQDGIQQRIVEQTIPAIPLTEKIVELPVIQTEETKQQGVNTHAQHVVNTVEVEKPKIIKQTRQKPIVQEKINRVTKHVEVPLSQFTDKIVDISVVAQREIRMNRKIQKTTEIHQLQITDEVVEVPAVLIVQVPQVQVVAKTVEIPQLRIVEKIDETPIGENPFAKVKGVITELISRLEEEDLDTDTTKQSFKLETVVSHTVDGEIPMLQSEFDALSKRQLHVGTVRAGERDVFAKVNADIEQVACETCVKDNMAMVAEVGDLSSTSGSMHQQHTSGQAGKEERGQTEEEGKEEKGQGEREKGRKGERGKEKERDAEEQECKQVKKDATGWTVVTRNKRQKKTVQIFVKLDEMKTVLREVSQEDKVQEILNTVGGSEQDVYVTCEGKMLRRDEQLKNCGVRDGSTIQVTSRVRGGKHKDKKSKAEKKQAASAKTPEQKFTDEEEGDRGPVTQECDRDAAIRMIEENEEQRKVMVRMLEENKDNRKMIENMSEGRDEDMERTLQNHRTAGYEVLGWSQEQVEMMERGLRWVVEARRKGRRQQEEEQRRREEQGHHLGQEQSKQGKQVRCGDEEQFEEAEVRTGRGSAGLVRGRDERCRTDETNRKGKGKGDGGKGEHECKGGGFGHNGKQQEMRERERNGSEWRQTWGPVAPPRPRRIQERERWRKRKKPEG